MNKIGLKRLSTRNIPTSVVRSCGVVWPQSEFLQWLSVTLSWSEGWLPVSARRADGSAGQHSTALGNFRLRWSPGQDIAHLTSHHIITTSTPHWSLLNAHSVKVILIRNCHKGDMQMD